MKMNYNDWFYNQHRYLKGNRNGKITFNDTKWVDINKRYRTLIDMESELLNEQPFGVVGNNTGFDKLLDLMSRSNYTFDDINESLIDTYQVSLKNAMSRMLVNTQSVMFHCTNMDSDFVSMDKFTHYYIIDIPFNQLHFGDRDEFIRQKLHLMHNTESDHYVPMSKFVTSEISSLLGFTIMCTVNGFICNDCMIAIDDKGFKFKIGWLYSSDVEFIIYKLDESVVYKCEIDASYITNNNTIPYSVLGDIRRQTDVRNKKCLLNIYDENFIKTVPSVPNFGMFDNEGLIIKNIQQKTIDNIKLNKSKSVTVVIYSFKYFHEVPNVYPAVNYYDIMDSRRVLTENYDNVKDVDGNTILATNLDDTNRLEICTPPISLDRNVSMSFKTIISCLNMYDDLIQFEDIFREIGNVLLQPDLTWVTFTQKVARPINSMYDKLYSCYTNYLQGAILTSLVPNKSIERFKELLFNLDKMRKLPDVTNVQLYTIDEYFGENYKFFVNAITAPFTNNSLSNFADLSDLSKNYFEDENSNRFNRPVTEQCFITLRYHRDEECWLFDFPNIKHFNGIGNTFYIDDDLKGDEVFKFFVLYTDTDGVSEKEVSDLTMDQVVDFDSFYTEVNKHIGYMRYWYAENKLLKISKIIYNKYDEDTCVQVLSKILKRKIDGEDLIDIYPSDINYEPSNITSDNINAGEYDDRGPFSINFLFYTLSMLYDNEDKLQTFFLNQLTNRKFDNRYADIDICDVVNESDSYPINYSQFSIAPNVIDTSSSALPLSQSCVFYGLPIVSNSAGTATIPNPYRYTFNIYNDELKYYLIKGDDLDHTYYVHYDNPSQYGYSVYSYHDDIYICRMMTLYLNYMYEYISDLQTNYTKTYNQTMLINSAIDTINKHIGNIQSYLNEEDRLFVHSDTQTIINSVIIDNTFVRRLDVIRSYISQIIICNYNNRNVSIIEFFNRITSTLKQVYVTTGFDNYAARRVRMLYIHLKKINSAMNVYEYKKWLNDIDAEMLKTLDSVLANNENFTLGDNIFSNMWKSLKTYTDNVLPILDSLKESIDDLGVTFQNEHINPIIEYCDDIINHYIFDMFTIDSIKYDKNISFDSRPSLLSITLSSDEHFYPPVGTALIGDITLIFHPITEKNKDGKYLIKSITKICEYACFDGSDINDCTMSIIDENGDTILATNVSITFNKIGSSADSTETFNQIMNMLNTTVDIENIHESYEVNSDGMIVNKKCADMNYEMLIGNHFTQLDHSSELILQPKTYLQGSVDRLYIPNQQINDFINYEHGHHISKRMFFKPTQVLHIPLDSTNNHSITSVGGKYFVGQHLYVSTDDNLHVFPIIVTAVDHSINSGFVEAVVDVKNARWFSVDDEESITKYLTTNVECTVLDDNIRNFLDEFSNSSYHTFSNGIFNTNQTQYDYSDTDIYSLPGDPIFVKNNTEYVYTRLNWFFNERIPNRFIDDEHKKHKFIYLGDGFINNLDDTIKIKMINHNFNEFTNPELYPILREEPNDHQVWDKEVEVFQQLKYASEMSMSDRRRNIEFYRSKLNSAHTESERDAILNEIDSLEKKLEMDIEYQKRLESYIQQLEPPTTWYNVRAYEDTLVYIANGRAKISPSFIPNIRDIPYNDKLNLFIYDWENKQWLSPSMYTIDVNMVDAVRLYEHDDYTTNNVLHSITINPTDSFVPSKKLLIYLSYESSDIYEDIPMNEYKCNVRFKPLLSLDNINGSFDPYKDIRIRKHFNGTETYVFDDYNSPDDFSIKESFHITRPKRSGRYTYAPTIRMCDLSVINGDTSYDFTKFDLYIRIPFKDVSTSRLFKVPTYNVTINQPIDCFVPNQIVKLICVQNTSLSSYDGNISNIMFEGLTSYSGDNNDVQTITITNSSLPNIAGDTFVCTIFRDDMYKTYGGLVTVEVTLDEYDMIDELNNWIKIPSTLSMYREIPAECIIVPSDDITLVPDDGVKIVFNNSYIKDMNDIVEVDNTNIFNPYEYYFNTNKEIRLPVSDVRRNAFNERLVLDKTINPDIKLIKSPYIGICRYSLHNIPENGFIDVTGYIPTPLSRNRYEFWVNGRCITDKKDVVIVSPTSIQLCNLKSLHNFELIELVDDVNDSNVIQKGNVYIDLNGNTFSSYKLALLSNSNIVKQDIRYVYNTNQHQKIHDYTKNIITDPNNHDIESNILDSIIIDNENDKDYNKLYNVPSINGVTIYHPTISSLGISEIPNDEILDLMDKTWRYEIITNPLFTNTHRDGMGLVNGQHVDLHIKSSNDNYDIGIDSSDMFIAYATGVTSKYFTLYISKKSDGVIDDVENTIKIIPFIKTGVYVFIDRSYRGLWLCSTMEHCRSVRIR